MKLKYVIVDAGFGCESAIVFPETLTHADVAAFYSGRVVSAGFCTISPQEGYVDAYGESISLNIKSRQQDGDIIADQILGA